MCMPKPKPSTRVGEAERTAAQQALQAHLNAGRLQVGEYADRSARASNAVLASELDDLFADLPAPHPKLPGRPSGTNRNLMLILVAVVVVLVVVLAALLFGGRTGGSPVAQPSNGPIAPSTAALAPSSATAIASSTEGPSGSAAPLPDGTTVRRTTGQTAITLRPSYGVDLDDTSSQNWNVSAGCCDGQDVRWAGDGNSLQFSGDFAAVTGPAAYATCAQETAYTNGGIERGYLQPEENLCVRTGGNRYAVITIVDVNEQAVEFRATVWDPPIS